MANVLRFEHVIALPAVHRILKALRAFFRASEVGPWAVDSTQRDDGATLHLIRGNWETSDLPGVGGVYRLPGFPRWVPQQGYVPATVPMLLSVTVTDSTDQMRIHLKHTALSREAGTELGTICQTAVETELKSLVKYLKQAFHLPHAPQVAVEPEQDPSWVA